jgi:MFS family permease
MTATAAGLILLPLSVAMIIAAPVGGALFDKFGSRVICGIGMGIIAVAAALLSSNITNATATLKASGIQGIALQQGAFAYAMRITCMVTACCAAVALVLSLAKGKAEKSSRRGDMKNAS